MFLDNLKYNNKPALHCLLLFQVDLQLSQVVLFSLERGPDYLCFLLLLSSEAVLKKQPWLLYVDQEEFIYKVLVSWKPKYRF